MNYNQNLVSALSAFTYDDFIRTDSIDPNQKIHENQLEAAIEIVKSMTGYILPEDEFTFRNRHILLMAQMQSGKTGTISGVINILKKIGWNNVFRNPSTSKGLERYFIVSGMNDNGLHEQTANRIMLQSFDAQEDDNVDSGSKDDIKKENCEFIIHKNFDLRESKYKLENCIIFVDESHYGSSKASVLTKFFDRSGVNWRNGKELRERNIFIISVSATSFDEIYSDVDDTKTRVTLYPTDTYIGITDFDDNDQIFEASPNDFKVNKETLTYPIEDYVKDAYDRMDENKKGITFVRAQGKKSKIILKSEIINNNFEVVELDADKGKVDYGKVREKVESMFTTFGNIKKKPILFLIKGSYRAGITLEEEFKDITFMVHDYSKETHATPQGLLGRMCGYRKNPELSKLCKFYVHYESATQYADWVREDFHKDNTPAIQTYVDYHDLTEEEKSKINKEKDGVPRSKGQEVHEFIIDETEIENIQNVVKGMSAKLKREWIEEKVRNEFSDVDFKYVGDYFFQGTYAPSTTQKWIESAGGSLRTTKSDFMDKNDGRDYFTKDDLGSKFIHFILIKDGNNSRIMIQQSILTFKYRLKNKEKMYREHKDTSKAKL